MFKVKHKNGVFGMFRGRFTLSTSGAPNANPFLKGGSSSPRESLSYRSVGARWFD